MTAPDLRLEGVLWMGDTCLIQDLALPCPAGKWTVLLGTSGIGKSTLGRVIVGLDGPHRLEGAFHRSEEGPTTLMAQDAHLLPWASALENVTLGARLRGEAPDTKRATALLGEVGLNGLETSKPAQLSGGQRHRVALARALMEDAALVVLDEPFSALDTATRLAIQDLAHKLLAGCTVILITHDPLEVARMGDRAYLLSSNGSSEISLPSASTPRAYDADGTLACQAALMRQLTGVRAA